MKLFFKIFNSENLSDIGHYPQTDFKKDYNPELPNSIWNIKPNEFPKFKLNYELELHENAIPTNCIEGVGNSGMLVDSKLKKILEEFNLPPYKFYPIKVFHKGQSLEYYYLHFIFNVFEFLKRDLSSFRVENNNGNFITAPLLNDDESLNTLINYYLLNIDYNLRPNKFVLDDKFPNYDLFSNRPLGVDTIISKRLKKNFRLPQH